VKINKSNNVENFIFKDNIYIFHLINDNTYVFTQCRVKAIRGADMRIIKKIKNNIVDNSENDYVFSYNYQNYDKIHFNSFNYMEEFDFEENSEELLKFKLRLRYSKALGSKFTEEQDEYNYVRSINHELFIQSKKEYTEKRRVHSNFIENPEDYFKAKGVWTDWYDFMGVDTLKFIQSKQEWKNFCKEMKITTLDKYYEGCELYNVLPKEPADFYKDFGNITDELRLRERRRK
jgi:hypothetical protein